MALCNLEMLREEGGREVGEDMLNHSPSLLGRHVCVGWWWGRSIMRREDGGQGSAMFVWEEESSRLGGRGQVVVFTMSHSSR